MQIASGVPFSVRVEYSAPSDDVVPALLPERVSAGVAPGVVLFEALSRVEPEQGNVAWLYSCRPLVTLTDGADGVVAQLANYIGSQISDARDIIARVEILGDSPMARKRGRESVRNWFGIGLAVAFGAVLLKVMKSDSTAGQASSSPRRPSYSSGGWAGGSRSEDDEN